MDMFEKFNAKFGKWYEGLFGGDAAELRPKDVLRKIIAAMEDNRKEGFDAKVYVPNKYVLELAVADADEREYLHSFLDEDELTQVLQRFMAQNKYHTRGPLEFTIADLPEAERDGRREKLRVKARFEKGEASAAPTAPPPIVAATPEEIDLPTVAAVGADLNDDLPTMPAVAWGMLTLTGPDGQTSEFRLTKPVIVIGRSRAAGNDIVLDADGMVSKSHARLERGTDGLWTISDLNSTNGVKVNGVRVDGNRPLTDGSEIVIGATQLILRAAAATESPAPASFARRPRLIGPDGVAHVLASETLVGRAVTADIVLNDAGVSTRHARLVAPDAQTCYVEDLDSASGTRLNGRPLAPRTRALLADGDTLAFGSVETRFQGGAA